MKQLIFFLLTALFCCVNAYASSSSEDPRRNASVSHALDTTQRQIEFKAETADITTTQKYSTPDDLYRAADKYIDTYRDTREREELFKERKTVLGFTTEKEVYKDKQERDEVFKSDWQEVFGLDKDVRLALGLKGGFIKGHSTYHISFSGGASELEWPLNTYLLGLSTRFLIRDTVLTNREKISLNFSWLKDVSHSGLMHDSDWLDGDGHPGLDIYSDSKTDVNFTIMDLNILYNFFIDSWISTGWVLGYKWHKYGYSGHDTDQQGFGPYDNPTYTASISGTTIVYSARYEYFYFGVAAELQMTKNFLFQCSFGYAPHVKSRDRDDHVLRWKLSEGEGTGDAFLMQCSGRWFMAPNIYLDLGVEYADIDTSGNQHQRFYSGPYVGITYDVADIITSEYYMSYLSLNILL